MCVCVCVCVCVCARACAILITPHTRLYRCIAAFTCLRTAAFHSPISFTLHMPVGPGVRVLSMQLRSPLSSTTHNVAIGLRYTISQCHWRLLKSLSSTPQSVDVHAAGLFGSLKIDQSLQACLRKQVNIKRKYKSHIHQTSKAVHVSIKVSPTLSMHTANTEHKRTQLCHTHISL